MSVASSNRLSRAVHAPRPRNAKFFAAVIIITIFVIFLLRQVLTDTFSYQEPRNLKSDATVWRAVTFDDHLLLLLRGIPRTPINVRGASCLLGSSVRTKVRAVEDGLAVRCDLPPLLILKKLKRERITVETDGFILPSKALLPSPDSWRSLTYEALPRLSQNELVVFAKGLIKRKKDRRPSWAIRNSTFCSFLEGKILTAVKEICQENLRCDLPEISLIPSIRGKPVTVVSSGRTLATAVLYPEENESAGKSKPIRRFRTCSCTVIWNSTRFVREWVTFHAFLGVEKFIFYDNDSEDGLVAELAALESEGFQVARRYWPWAKTQEAAFSHCALSHVATCDWMFFADVDEFLFPEKFLEDGGNQSLAATSPAERSESPVDKLLNFAVELTNGGKIGEVQIPCHDFGPSGLKILPRSGQMVNYICRESSTHKMKSFVLLKAVDGTACNVVHHFDLKEEFDTVKLPTIVASIKHYKYQVWDIFKSKFHRRVATFVKDWGTKRKKIPVDRVEGLGLKAVKPVDWESKFCQVNDTKLRDFVIKTFKNSTTRFPWE